jgi:Protein of unknown function (DUF5132)
MAPKLVPELEDLVEGLGIPGIAAIVLLPVIVPVAAGLGKPIAKTMIKGGIVLYEKGKGVLAQAGENFEDILAEIKAELAEDKVKGLEAAVTHSE